MTGSKARPMAALHARLLGMPPGEKDALLQRLATVQSWVDGYSGRIRLRPPDLRIGLYAAYFPLSHRMSLSVGQLTETREEVLRVIVAHEIGHARRRYRCMLAWSLKARLMEEVAADQMAHLLTTCDLATWEEAMKSAEDDEGGPQTDVDRTVQDMVWKGRQRRLAAFMKSLSPRP